MSTVDNVIKNSEATVRVNEMSIRNLVKTVYDIQKLRIATGNRVVQSFNIQMGQKPSTSQDDMDEKAQKVITELRKEYSRITDAYVSKSYIVSENKTSTNAVEKEIKVAKNAGVEAVIKSMTSNDPTAIKYIKEKLDYELVGAYVELLNTENNVLKLIKKEVEKHPLWDAFFSNVKGCGPLMSAVCITYFDINKARHVSSFWKYAGLDTVEVTKGMDEAGEEIRVREGRAMRHTEMFEYKDADGNIKEKRGITFNPELKCKLIGVLGSSFLKCPGSYYEQIYRDYKFRLENRANSDKLTKSHKHNMAVRYMVKQFIRDLWVTWRAMAGYEVTEPYEVAYLGNKPHKYNEYHERMASGN